MKRLVCILTMPLGLDASARGFEDGLGHAVLGAITMVRLTALLGRASHLAAKGSEEHTTIKRT